MQKIEQDAKSEMQGLKDMGIEITSESLEKYTDSQCNLTTCRYNQSGICTNEGKRKECVEVSKRVFCLENGEEMNVQKREVSQSEIVRRYLVTSDADRAILKNKFPYMNFSEKSMIKFLKRLKENDIEYEFLKALKEIE